MDEQRDSQTYAIIGAAMEVHRTLGHGFLESAYQEALALELTSRQVPFEREVLLHLHYKGQPLRTSFRADFICHGEVIVEVKAQQTLTSVDEAQVINYLKATRLHRALLLNFGEPSLRHRRLVLNL